MTKRGTNAPLDEMQWREIFAIIAVGCGRTTAANYVGCSPATIRRAELRDPEIARRLAHAESQSEVFCLRNIHEAAKVDRHWRAAAWVLERTLPAKYCARPGKAIPVATFRKIFPDVLKTVRTTKGDAVTKQEITRRLKLLFAGYSRRRPPKQRRQIANTRSPSEKKA